MPHHMPAGETPLGGPKSASALLALYLAGCLTCTAYSGFHVGLNDFWGNVALARQVRWTTPATLFNQFFPLGYTAVLALIGPNPVVPAHLINTAFGAVLLTAAWRFGRRMVEPRGALLAAGMLALHPQVFRYVTTPGPDIPAAALLAVAFHRMFWRDSEAGDRRASPFMTGALFGAAALFRYHALVLAAGAIVAMALVSRKNRTALLYTCGGLACVYALQMTVSVLAQQSPFESGQSVNLYKLVHGFDWFNSAAEPVPPTAWEVVATSPGAFGRAYLNEVRSLWPLLVAPALLALTGRDSGRLLFGRVAFMTTASYLLVVAAGGSSRGSLPVQFLVVLAVVAILYDALALARSAGIRRDTYRMGIAGAAGVLATLWTWSVLKENYGTVKYRALANQSYRRVEALLRNDGVSAAQQVFTSDFSVYFPSLAGLTPRTNGSWLRLDDAYSQRVPQLCVDSAECFRRDAVRSGVTHVVLTPLASRLSAEIGALYAGERKPGFDFVGRDSEFAVYRVR